MNISFDWLHTLNVDEEIIANKVKCEEAMMVWSTLTVPNLTEYINIDLYFIGHLHSDTVLQSQPMFVTSLSTAMDDLAAKFEKLISQPLKTINLYVSDPSKGKNTPMDVVEPKQIPPSSDTVPPTDENVLALRLEDDSDMKVDPAHVL